MTDRIVNECYVCGRYLNRQTSMDFICCVPCADRIFLANGEKKSGYDELRIFGLGFYGDEYLAIANALKQNGVCPQCNQIH